MTIRLSEDEIATIARVCTNADPKALVYLYGSRIDPQARGGDIDILLISDTLSFRHKLDILSDLKERLGDQKIDLTILPPAELATDVFFKDIAKVKIS